MFDNGSIKEATHLYFVTALLESIVICVFLSACAGGNYIAM